MIVKIQILYDDLTKDLKRSRDEVIRAVDKVMGGADWEADENGGWIARR